MFAWLSGAALTRATAYLGHHAARYGWLPPSDGNQALVVLAGRLWELVAPDEQPEYLRALERATRQQANQLALRTFSAYSAVGGLLAEKPVSAEGVICSWLTDGSPWEYEASIWEARNVLGPPFRLAYQLGVKSQGDLARNLAIAIAPPASAGAAASQDGLSMQELPGSLGSQFGVLVVNVLVAATGRALMREPDVRTSLLAEEVVVVLKESCHGRFVDEFDELAPVIRDLAGRVAKCFRKAAAGAVAVSLDEDSSSSDEQITTLAIKFFESQIGEQGWACFCRDGLSEHAPTLLARLAGHYMGVRVSGILDHSDRLRA